jgi:hypothetical protein
VFAAKEKDMLKNRKKSGFVPRLPGLNTSSDHRVVSWVEGCQGMDKWEVEGVKKEEEVGKNAEKTEKKSLQHGGFQSGPPPQY